MSDAHTCPDDQQLRRLLDADDDNREAAQLAQHLDHCESCQQRLLRLTDSEQLLPEHATWFDPVADQSTRLEQVIQELRGAACLPLEPRLDFLTPTNQPGCIGEFGPYQVLERISHGGMGIVLKALDPALRRVVAIKVLHPHLATSGLSRKRFVREAQAAAAVSHDHVVTIHAVGEHQGLPFLVMKFVEGQSLRDKIESEAPLELHEILRIGVQTAAGLAAAHAQGLIHRDIKPANILLENGIARVKITDFGLARAVDDVRLTRTGAVAGTPQFMAPEQASGKTIDHRCDLFSLGAVLYAMCTGNSPFAGTTTMDVIRRVCETQPPRIRECNPAIPDYLQSAVERLLAKKPGKRFQTAGEVANLLAERLAQLQGDPSPFGALGSPVPTSTDRRRWTAVGLVALSLVLVPLAWWFGREWSGPATAPEQSIAVGLPPSNTGQPSERPFLVAASGVRFASLAEAVAATPAGGVVEIHGRGPHAIEPLDLGAASLVIRGGGGEMPILQPSDPQASSPLISSTADLVLEGLALEVSRDSNNFGRGGQGSMGLCLVEASGPSLRLVGCRFRLAGLAGAVRFSGQQSEFGNCHFDCRMGVPLFMSLLPEGRCQIQNCVLLGRVGMVLFPSERPEPQQRHHFRLDRNTIVADFFARWMVTREQRIPSTTVRFTTQVRFETRQNLFDVERLLTFAPPWSRQVNFEVDDTPDYVRHMLHWEGEGNFYTAPLTLASTMVRRRIVPVPFLSRGLPAWSEYWDSDQGSLSGSVEYEDAESGEPDSYRVIRWDPAPETAPGADVEKVAQ